MKRWKLYKGSVAKWPGSSLRTTEGREAISSYRRETEMASPTKRARNDKTIILQQPYKSKQGTILVEALLAVAILSVSVVIMLQSLVSAARASSQAEIYGEVADLLENRIAEFILSPQDFIDGKKDLIKGNFNEYVFQSTRGGQNFKEGYDLQPVIMAVSWGEGRFKKEISVETLVNGK